MRLSKYSLLIATASWLLLLERITAITSQDFQDLFNGDTPNASLLDPTTQALFVTATPANFVDYFTVYRINANGGQDFRKSVDFRSGRLVQNPSAIAWLSTSDLLVILANGSYDDAILNGGGDCTIYFMTSDTGVLDGSFVTLKGPDFVDTTGVSNNLLTANKVIQSSSDPDKIYVMATSLMDIDNSAYGYSIFKIDVPSRTIDWANHYIPAANPLGGTPSDILEVNSSYLIVAGFLGLMQYDLSTGNLTEILPNARVNNLLHVDNLIVVGGAGSDSSTALDDTTLSAVWSAPDGRGIAYHSPGPATNTVWFTKVIIPEASLDWDLEVGVISLVDGSMQWSQQYDGGYNEQDLVIGFYSTGDTAYLGASGYTEVSGICCRIASFLGLSRLFGGFVGDTRVLSVSHSSQSVVYQLVDTSIGSTGAFHATGTLGWSISYDGRAIRYDLM